MTLITFLATSRLLAAGNSPALIHHPASHCAHGQNATAKRQTKVKWQTKVQFGKYTAELRVPQGGLFANEEIDVEFRVVDTTQADPNEEGFKGVAAIEATAIMTMPSMAGMPAAKPRVHREGVPGDYGIELFFPHGGGYRIDLMLKVPGESPQSITFLVDVQDERQAGKKTTPPYQLKVTEWPKTATAGKPTMLKLKVIESKSGKIQTQFDEAHTKLFHLLIASKDLNWFLHEHPEMDRNGTWSVPITFPAGTDYLVFGDVAPTGKGSQILMTQVSVAGPKPKWNRSLGRSTQSADGSMTARLQSLAPIEIGRSSTLQVKLFDKQTKRPVGDTVPWLGAAGHMMIFHKDGKTVVHSHPDETKESERLIKQGVVRFNARFPKAGVYKVYAQFDRGGRIHTLPFAIEVKSR